MCGRFALRTPLTILAQQFHFDLEYYVAATLTLVDLDASMHAT